MKRGRGGERSRDRERHRITGRHKVRQTGFQTFITGDRGR